VASGDFPHFLIYGPNSAGKKTRITCVLNELYGNDGIQSLRLESHQFTIPPNKKKSVQLFDLYFPTFIYNITLPPELAKRIAKKSNRNLRRALLI
ncbi:unnamed protein product, partial [Didymodactylos carnosus]